MKKQLLCGIDVGSKELVVAIDPGTGRHGKAKALSILAAKLGRAVYFMLSKDRVFEMERFLAKT